MKQDSHEITIDPFFLNDSARFNIEAQTKEANGKIQSLDYFLTFPKPKPKPEPKKKQEPGPIDISDISLNDLLKVCCHYFGVMIQDVKGNYRGGNTIKARLIYMAIAKRECDYKLKFIAGLVNKDHASVSNACKSVFKDEIYPDERITLKQHYDAIVEQLRR